MKQKLLLLLLLAITACNKTYQPTSNFIDTYVAILELIDEHPKNYETALKQIGFTYDDTKTYLSRDGKTARSYKRFTHRNISTDPIITEVRPFTAFIDENNPKSICFQAFYKISDDLPEMENVTKKYQELADKGKLFIEMTSFATDKNILQYSQSFIKDNK